MAIGRCLGEGRRARRRNRTNAVVAELEKMHDEPTIFGPRTFTKTLHYQNWVRYLISELWNGKPRIIDKWTISRSIPVGALLKK
ncbi:MAG: hypothetical protein OXC93_01235 [Rhodospirillaceae bacterium]|nr:hypothetical protein [Rhodospirillaceae bacterium]